MEMALVAEPRRGRGRGNRLAGFEQPPRDANPVSDLKRVRRQPCPRSEEANEAELVDAGDRGKLVEPHISCRLVTQEVAGETQRAVVPRGQRRVWPPRRGGAIDKSSQPAAQMFISLESRSGRRERRVQTQEAGCQVRVRED